jgi:hypothetical protein
LIAPTSPGAAVDAAVIGQSGGRYRLSVQIAGRHLSFLVGPDGSIRYVLAQAGEELPQVAL